MSLQEFECLFMSVYNCWPVHHIVYLVIHEQSGPMLWVGRMGRWRQGSHTTPFGSGLVPVHGKMDHFRAILLQIATSLMPALDLYLGSKRDSWSWAAADPPGPSPPVSDQWYLVSMADSWSWAAADPPGLFPPVSDQLGRRGISHYLYKTVFIYFKGRY